MAQWWENPWFVAFVMAIISAWVIEPARQRLLKLLRSGKNHQGSRSRLVLPPGTKLRAEETGVLDRFRYWIETPIGAPVGVTLVRASTSGAFAGLAALYFYRAFLPWIIARAHVKDVPGMVASVWAHTGPLEVFYGMIGGAFGGFLISTCSIFRRKARASTRTLVDWSASLLGGCTLAAVQLGVGHAAVPWYVTHWPEFFAFGAGATLTVLIVIDFAGIRGMSDTCEAILIPPVVGGLFFGLVQLVRLLPWIPAIPPQPGYDGWLAATAFTCPMYTGVVVAMTYSQIRFSRLGRGADGGGAM